MRFFFAFLLLLLVSCRLSPGKEQPDGVVTGNWLVLYADHELKNQQQRQVYGRIQDSVIAAKGLKLVSFFEDGSFRQMDSLQSNGRWVLSPGKEFYVIRGGNGFDDFKSGFLSYEKEVMKIAENVHAGGETIRLVWFLKKIKETDLFEDRNNDWRRKPVEPESDPEIKTRLAAMLRYYSAYYKLVQKEASYFIGTRVILPFNYYQHAMGIKPFDSRSDFTQQFFNTEQAEEAYGYLNKTMRRLDDQYPDLQNYVAEYAGFMELMAKEITRIE